MLHCLRYWRCRLRIRRLRLGSEWASASVAMWLGRRSALTGITRTIRMVARLTATTVRAGLRTGSLLAQGPGTTAGDIHITHATTVATLTADLRDADLRDMVLIDMVLIDMVLIDMVLIDMVRRFGAASKGTTGAKASAEGSRVAANN